MKAIKHNIRDRNSLIIGILFSLTQKNKIGYLTNDYFYDMEEKKDNQVNIELTDEVANGVYSNLAIITHSPSEFIADFVQMMPGVPKGKVRSRVIMTPQNAKRLMEALQENVGKYEQNHGVIESSNMPPMPPMNFGTPTTQA